MSESATTLALSCCPSVQASGAYRPANNVLSVGTINLGDASMFSIAIVETLAAIPL